MQYYTNLEVTKDDGKRISGFFNWLIDKPQRIGGLLSMNQANLKSQLRIELFALLTLSIVFLVLFPQRSTIVDFGLGLFALLLLGLNTTFTKTTVWGQFPPAGRQEDRFRICLRAVFTITLPLVIGMFGAGLINGYLSGGWIEAFNRVSNWHLLIVLILYFPWALLQQTLFQFYLFGRLLSLFPKGLAITCTGLAYGLVHLPDVWITIAAATAGIVWTFLYHRYRVLTPLALSHAALGSTFYYWVYGRDLFERWMAFLN